jgi:hypothetical protein
MMIDLVSHYEHAATHVVVIIWSKDLMCVIKSLETTNLLKMLLPTGVPLGSNSTGDIMLQSFSHHSSHKSTKLPLLINLIFFVTQLSDHYLP